ncbi:hypothetical protein Q3G72_002666 [Acer saccharum]|nr:hypothetical protein Q3G72_002666 [Acer saccharum]
MPDSDYISRGDFLELLHLLDEPASPSSSSETSSCVTMSSDDFFDLDTWLRKTKLRIMQGTNPLPLHPTDQLNNFSCMLKSLSFENFIAITEPALKSQMQWTYLIG